MYLIGTQYLARKASHGGDRRSEGSSGQSDHLKKTAEAVAAENKVAEKTVRRAAKFAQAVDTLAANVGEEIREKILSRDASVTAKAVRNQPSVKSNAGAFAPLSDARPFWCRFAKSKTSAPTLSSTRQ